MKKFLLAALIFLPGLKSRAAVVPAQFSVAGSSVLVVTSDANGNVVLKGSATVSALKVGASGIKYNDGSVATSASGSNAWNVVGDTATSSSGEIIVPNSAQIGGVKISSFNATLPSNGNFDVDNISISSGGLATGGNSFAAAQSSFTQVSNSRVYSPIIGFGWQNYQKFTTTGTWIAPANVTRVMAWIVGAGGGGSGFDDGSTTNEPGAGGGGGCTDILISTVTSGNSYSIVIGGGGSGGASGADGSNGNATTFLADSAGGGGGALASGASSNAVGGAGGTCSGSGLFFPGSVGQGASFQNLTSEQGEGGGSAGGIGAAGAAVGGTSGNNAAANSGGGGSGGGKTGTTGGTGGSGYVIIWW